MKKFIFFFLPVRFGHRSLAKLTWTQVNRLGHFSQYGLKLCTYEPIGGKGLVGMSRMAWRGEGEDPCQVNTNQFIH